MEEDSKSSLSTMVQLSLVKKVEPVDEKLILCGEYVDSVLCNLPDDPPSFAVTRDPLETAEITGGTLYKLKDVQVNLIDVVKEFNLKMKAYIKDEPEVHLSNQSFENHVESVMTGKNNDDVQPYSQCEVTGFISNDFEENRPTTYSCKTKSSVSVGNMNMLNAREAKEQPVKTRKTEDKIAKSLSNKNKENYSLNRKDTHENKSPSKKKNNSTEKDKGSSDLGTEQVSCTAKEDGILCQCSCCTKIMRRKQLSSDISKANTDASDKPFVCESCKLRFKLKSRLRKHLKTHEGVKPYPCDICGSAFTGKTSLKNHKLIKHTCNPFKEICTVCGKVFVSKSSLHKHINNVHLRLSKNVRIKCEYCEKSFSSRKCYLRHIHELHLKDQEFICGHCDKIFNGKASLVLHIQKLHLPKEKHPCNICGSVFSFKPYLYAHKNKHHSGYNCEKCGKIVTTKRKLELHMVCHSDEKPFTCETCGKGFKRPLNLQQHQYTHSKARPFVCDICGQTFRLRTHIKQHMAVHGLVKNHECIVCGKKFAKKTELKSHLSVHGV